MNPYPKFQGNVEDVLVKMIKERPNDISEIQNLSFFRKTTHIPTSSTNIISSDRVGDMSIDVNYLYICVNNNGNAVWRRLSLGTF